MAGPFDARDSGMGRRSIGVRGAMFWLFGVLVAVALVSGATLVAVTAALGHKTADVAGADARMRASLRAKSAVLWYGRESDVAVLQGTPEARARQDAAEQQLWADVNEMRRIAPPERIRELDSVEAKIEDYVATRTQLQREGLPLDEILGRATPVVEPLFADLQQLVQADERWAEAKENSARALAAGADMIGATAAALLLLGFGAAFDRTIRWVEWPLVSVRDAIARFGSGDVTSRAVPQGVRELREIAVAFDENADRLVRQDRERLAFIAGVAHDLRNPLTPLKLAVGRARAAGHPLSPEAYAKILDSVDRQVARLERMIGDLLDATRIESGQLELHPARVDLGGTIESVAELYRPTSPIHSVDVHQPAEPLVVDADPVRVEQVLINLVSNAIKYSPNGGRVTMVLSGTREEATVTVSDEGIGVPPTEREKIFEPFHRSGRTRGETPGVGLGLAVARKIAEAHGGRLVLVESERGATFRLTLPMGA